jgi:hypothetical protein
MMMGMKQLLELLAVKLKCSEKTCPSVTLSTMNPICPDPDLNPEHHIGKPVTNHLSYGTPNVKDLLAMKFVRQ